MDLDQYYSLDGESLQFSRAQSSAFAKEVAGDFNPIHDVDAKRFCVPGDLLFAVLLHRYGVRETMHVEFSGMVADNTPLHLPASINDQFSLCGEGEKTYLEIDAAGAKTESADFVKSLTQQYVMFSGQTFPHILVGLMQDNNVMINPDRPLVIYKNMSIQLSSMEATTVSLQLADASLRVDGKKGHASLRFLITDDVKEIGCGEKTMVLSGLREYDQELIDRIVNEYAGWKSAYGGNQN
ncbi:MAG: DUF3581 family protein [Pseudomonadota bacterium]